MITEHAQALFDPMLGSNLARCTTPAERLKREWKKPLTFTSEARFIMKHGTDFLLLFSSSGHAEGANRLLEYTRWNYKLSAGCEIVRRDYTSIRPNWSAVI